MNKVVLVTGASSGLGKHMATLLAEHGFAVYGTSRHPKSEMLNGYHMVTLDVTDDASAKACVEEVLQRAGRIDILVNNAGVGIVGASEETSIEEAKTFFETNFFGVMRMVNAVLPAMRAQESGHIINIGSAAGLGASPFQTMYCASKHAIEGYTDSLAYELEQFNIRVSLVEPGYFKSEINQHIQVPENKIEAYGELEERAIKGFQYRLENAPEPDPVAETVLKLAQGRSKKLRNPVGAATHFYQLKYLVPDWVTRKRIRKISRLD